MIAAEFKTPVSTVRIHDEYFEIPAGPRISHLGRIISASYRRRRLPGPGAGPSAAAGNLSAKARNV